MVNHCRLWVQGTGVRLVVTVAAVVMVAAGTVAAAPPPNGQAAGHIGIPADPDVQGISAAAAQHSGGASISWSQVAAAGYKFAAIQATEGTYYTNPYFAADLSAAKSAGLYAGASHFANPSSSNGTTQADYAVSHAHYAADGKTLPIELDIENNPYGPQCYGLSPSQMVSWIGAFSSGVQARTGRLPIIYTDAGWWDTCTGDSTAFAANPLWVASYSTPNPPLPAGWGSWTFWQHASGPVPGVSGAVGLSYFHGDSSALATFVGGSAATSRPMARRGQHAPAP
jgi:GH25 family lysozyme M1 (1,4-beta-N-acetylmuramidase)